MSTEGISVVAEQLYREHGRLAARLAMYDDVIRDSTERTTDLRLGYALTSYGLGGEAAIRQADIIAENMQKYTEPRRNEAKSKFDANIHSAALHYDQYTDEYWDMAQSEIHR